MNCFVLMGLCPPFYLCSSFSHLSVLLCSFMILFNIFFCESLLLEKYVSLCFIRFVLHQHHVLFVLPASRFVCSYCTSESFIEGSILASSGRAKLLGVNLKSCSTLLIDKGENQRYEYSIEVLQCMVLNNEQGITSTEIS